MGLFTSTVECDDLAAYFLLLEQQECSLLCALMCVKIVAWISFAWPQHKLPIASIC